MIKFIIALLLFSTPSFATLNNVDKMVIFNKQILLNGGFENGKAYWTASAGTFAVTTTNPMIGGMHATWDAAASADTLSSSLVATPVGMAGQNGVASCLITTPSGTATHSLQVHDGSNILATTTITSSTTPTRTSVNFIFPSSGTTTRIRLYANANEPSISIDDCYAGLASGYNFALGQGQDVFGAYVAAAGTVTKENYDWLNGNCVVTGTSVFTCAVTSGVFSTTPNCVATLDRSTTSNAHVSFDAGNSTSSSLIFRTNDATPSASAIPFQISCQKASVDAPAMAFKADTLANSWSGVHDSTCSWSLASASFADPTGDATCALTQKTNSSFGTVTTTSDGTGPQPGITFTPSRAGRYFVCANLSGRNSSAADKSKYSLTDGSTEIASQTFSVGGSAYWGTSTLCGFYNATSTSSVTLKIQMAANGGTTNVLTGDTTTALVNAINWSIFQVDQQIPAPLLVNSVVNPSSGVTQVVSANITNSGTPTVGRQDGSWISSLTDGGTGITTINITASTFSAAPTCTCNGADSGGLFRLCIVPSTSSSAVTIRTGNTGGTLTDVDFTVICVGAK